MFQHIIQELITKAITQQTEKIIEKKTKKQIKKEEVYFQKPHLFISNYYQAYAFLLTLHFLLIILTLCMIIQFKNNHLDMVIICVLLILLLITVTYKQNHKKLMIAYWQDILIIYNAKGTQLIQIPAYYLKQAIIKPNKLIIPYHQETWVIQINKHDNLKEVEEMLTYFQLL